MAETELSVATAPAAPGRTRWSRAPAIAIVVVLVLYLGSLLGRVAVPREDTALFAFTPSMSPSGDHLLGTGGSGRDVLATLVYSTAPTFAMALLAGLAATLVGTAAGLVSGYYRGAPDTAVRGVADIMLAVPAFAMLILLASIMGRLSLVGMALVIALFSWPPIARAVRAQVLTLRDQPFVTISRLSNRGDAAILALELLPNLLALVAAAFVGAVSAALGVAIGLELIGLGPANTQTLGVVLQSALSRGALSQGLWWWWLPPAAILILFFVCLFLVSLAVDRISNPRLRGAANG